MEVANQILGEMKKMRKKSLLDNTRPPQSPLASRPTSDPYGGPRPPMHKEHNRQSQPTYGAPTSPSAAAAANAAYAAQSPTRTSHQQQSYPQPTQPLNQRTDSTAAAAAALASQRPPSVPPSPGGYGRHSTDYYNRPPAPASPIATKPPVNELPISGYGQSSDYSNPYAERPPPPPPVQPMQPPPKPLQPSPAPTEHQPYAQPPSNTVNPYDPRQSSYAESPPPHQKQQPPPPQAAQLPQQQPQQPAQQLPQQTTIATFPPKGAPTAPPAQRQQKIGLDHFNFLAVLGKGNFGKVMLAETKATKKLYAIKVLKKEFIIENDEVESTRSEKRVFLVANKERHPFLLNLHACFQTETRVYFVMEYISGGDLMLHIQREQFGSKRAQ